MTKNSNHINYLVAQFELDTRHIEEDNSNIILDKSALNAETTQTVATSSKDPFIKSSKRLSSSTQIANTNKKVA
jgi:hypothetical protein